jgi:hypothetical protein
MPDIFFSYSSRDRERVRPIRDALASQGFDVFWDQSVPSGVDWDTWIRRHLGEAKCAIVVWSSNSVKSDNVRHEATVAKQQGKFVPVLLDPIAADEFPMGLYSVQGANLTTWSGDKQDPEWCKLERDLQAKLTPAWMRRITDEMEAELIAERSRREGAERRDKTLRDQISKEARLQQELAQERDQAVERAAAMKSEFEATIATLNARIVDLEKPAPAPTPTAANASTGPETKDGAVRAPRAPAAAAAKDKRGFVFFVVVMALLGAVIAFMLGAFLLGAIGIIH